MKQEAVEASIAAASSKLSYTTAGTMGLAGWLTSDIVFGVIGVLLGLATWATNRHYRRKEDRRQALRAKRDDEQARRQHSSWVMDMRAKYTEAELVAQLGDNWSDFIKLPPSGDTDLGALS